MSTSLSLLGLLENEPAHGYALKRRYDAHLALDRQLAFGQVYAALARLEKRGLAELIDVKVEAGPERRRYRITQAGVRALDTWMKTAESVLTHSPRSLFAKVCLALQSGRDAREVLAIQRRAHQDRVQVLAKAQRTAGFGQVLALTLELNHLYADLRWIKDVESRLGQIAQTMRG